MRLSHYRFAQTFALVLAAMASGCAANRYRVPITGFQTAAGTAIASVRTYYLEANKVERDKFLDGVTMDKEVIEPKELEKIRGSFSTADIGARLDALGLLSDYTNLLLRLASSTAPGDSATQAGAVEASLNRFAARTGKLCDATDKRCLETNQDFQAKVTGVSGAIQPILRSILEKKIERGLDKSIQGGEKPVAELIDAIRGDMALLQERREKAISQLLSAAVKRYNDEAKKGDSADAAKLTALADRVKAISDQQDQLAGANPERALAAMNKAHQALVQASRRDKSPANLGELADAVQAFANEAQLAGRSLRALTGI